jgi:UDP-arabinose 4-epimerase
MAAESRKQAVLVAGGAGYIGAHTCKALSRSGFEPVVYDNLSEGDEDSVRWGPFEKGDILDRERIDQVLDRYKPTAVLHFAARAYVSESVTDPMRYWHNNVTGTLTLLEAMRASGVDKFVFSSSCAIFGTPSTQNIDEHVSRRPVNPYGRTKLAIELVLKDCHRAFGLNSVSLRYFNAAGADPEQELGENHQPETHLIPLVLNSVMNPNQPVTVYGTDYETFDGTCVRDFVHVSDLADAHIRALIYLQNQPGQHCFNLGAGEGYSVMQIINSVASATGKQPNVTFGARRPGDPPILVANPGKAQKILGWEPQYPDIKDIIDSTWKWCLREGD